MNKQPVSYLQYDKRWKDKPYRVPGEDATVGGSGCGPSCAAMVISTLTGKTYTPLDACNWSVAHGYKALKQGTYYGYFVPQLKAFGIGCRRLNTASVYHKPNSSVHDEMIAWLKKGYYVIALMKKGFWTGGGHFVLVWWADNKIRINDPASTKTARRNGDIKTFCNEAAYYWLVDARDYNREEDDEMLSYEQWKEYMTRYQKELSETPDSKVPEWARREMDKAKALGICDGTRPLAIPSRVEVASMVARGKEG